jgi:hypothetical protein
MAVSKSLRYQILRRDNHTCRYCGRSAPEVKLTVDHVLAEALGGGSEPGNLVTACSDCNGGKSATPADAALVADVEADALRWSLAISVAADRMLADLEARNATRGEFEAGWNRWTVVRTGKAVPLPPDWGVTVDRFMANGLPMPILLDCIDVAMQAPKAKDEFRYTCGLAWRRVGELHDAARAAAGGEHPGGEHDPDADQELNYLAGLVNAYERAGETLLKKVPLWLHERAERLAEKQYRDAGEPTPNRLEHVPLVLVYVGGLLGTCEVEGTPKTYSFGDI